MEITHSDALMSLCFPTYIPTDINSLNFRAGDLIFFKWRPTLPCTSVALATASKYIHVGIVLSFVDQYGITSLCFLESQRYFGDGLKDELTLKFVHTGVRLSRLVQRLEAARSPFYVRKADDRLSEMARRKGAAFARKYAGRPYEKSLLTMVNAAWHLKYPKKDMSSVFCSELVAQFLIKLHQLDQNVASSYYSPGGLAKIALLHHGSTEPC